MTRRTAIAFTALLLPAAPAQKRKGADRPPNLEVVEFSVRRTSAGVLEIDGRVRNCCDRRLERVKLIFYIISPDGKVVTTQKGALDDEALEPGDGSSFMWQTRDHVRAVYLRIGATDRMGNELVLTKPGPYPIE